MERDGFHRLSLLCYPNKKTGSFCSSENIIFLVDLAQLQSGWPFQAYTKKEIQVLQALDLDGTLLLPRLSLLSYPKGKGTLGPSKHIIFLT